MPTHLKLLRGNPGRRPLNRDEPKPALEVVVPGPLEWLNDYAKEEWRRVAPEMHHMRLLTMVDINLFAAYCVAFSHWRLALEALARVAEKDPVFSGFVIKTPKGAAVQNPLFLAARQSANDMLKFASEFGMTPAARTRIRTGVFEFGPKPPSKFAGLLAGDDDWRA